MSAALRLPYLLALQHGAEHYMAPAVGRRVCLHFIYYYLLLCFFWLLPLQVTTSTSYLTLSPESLDPYSISFIQHIYNPSSINVLVSLYLSPKCLTAYSLFTLYIAAFTSSLLNMHSWITNFPSVLFSLSYFLHLCTPQSTFPSSHNIHCTH